jgi:plastocyanin
MIETRNRRQGPALRIITTVAIATLSLLTACALGGPAYAPSQDSTAQVVEMTSTLSFYPSELHIRAGDAVEWRNRSLFTHTVTDDPAKASNPEDSALPPGAEPFSAQVAPGEVYRHTFTVPGTYRYFCEPHEGLDMLGRVVVEPAT